MLKKLLNKLNKKFPVKKYFKGDERPKSPREQFGAVFDIVQLSRTFADSKTFVDMVPKKRPRRIIKDYLNQYGKQLDINGFVYNHFDPPWMPEQTDDGEIGERKKSALLMVREHIDKMWDVLTREADSPNRFSSLLPLPFRYVVPGGRFREIFYWDSYFTMLGLRESNRHDLIEDMIKNFVYIIETYGFIPNGNRTYYLTRSQPPFFSLMINLLAEIQGENILVEHLPSLLKEYKFWMRGSQATKFINKKTDAEKHVVRMKGGEIMNRYWDESFSPREESFIEDVEVGKKSSDTSFFNRNIRTGAESGWDYSSRWFIKDKGIESIRTTNMIPIDLNVLLYLTEETLSLAYKLANKPKLSAKYNDLACERRDAIQKYLWDEKTGWFCDYVFTDNKRDARPTLAGMFALFGGIANTEQASCMIEILKENFLHPGGLTTTLETTSEQWDAPNGWAPLQYISVMGLDRYGAFELAEEVAVRWCALNINVYEQTGSLFEKYNVEDVNVFAGGGEYPVQTGFGWTNGVLLTLMNKYHINKEIPAEVDVPIIESMQEPQEQV